MLRENKDDGFLIDADLGIKTNSDRPSSALNKTGTMVFMAIGALYGEPYSFLHDLESIFWLLFRVSVHWDGPNRARRNMKGSENWNCKPTKELAMLKIGMVSEEDKFQEEMNENLSPYCKPLIPCVQELRKVVFPDGKRWLTEDTKLYSQMKAVLEKAREDLGKLQ